MFDVYEADEAFFAATPFCMLPVTSINKIDIGDGKVGGVFKKLINKWSKEVKIDIIKQIQNWDTTKLKDIKKPTPYKFQK